MQISKAAIFYNAHKMQNAPLAKSVQNFLESQGIQAPIMTELTSLTGVELLVSVGGDGTLLRCARTCAPLQIPIFGINGGTLGFLATTEQKELEKNLLLFLQGKLPLQERLLLQANVQIPNEKPVTYVAFNDCVIRSAQPRAYTLQASFSGQEMPSYFGDGVIISTPTGSTAYSLAAGGPIVAPGVDVLVVTPICPHTLHQRPLVLPATGTLVLTPKLEMETDRATLSLDGQINLTLTPGTKVTLTRSIHKVRLVCNPQRSFFTLLNRKLNWGAR